MTYFVKKCLKTFNGCLSLYRENNGDKSKSLKVSRNNSVSPGKIGGHHVFSIDKMGRINTDMSSMRNSKYSYSTVSLF